MSDVDWDASLQHWLPSGPAEAVVDATEISSVERMLKWVGENRFEKIEYFDSGTLESKDTLQDDGLSKNEVLVMASVQLAGHKRIWRTHKDQERFGMRTYEMPFASPSPLLRYLKFQFRNHKGQLSNPRNIDPFYIRYHESKQALGVIRI